LKEVALHRMLFRGKTIQTNKQLWTFWKH